MSVRTRLNQSLRKFEKPYDTYNQITVSRAALLHNFDLLAAKIPSGDVFPVLKSNAYGHGIAEVATILKERSFPYFAVDGFYESSIIASLSKQPVLIMGAIKPDNFSRIRFGHNAFAVSDIPALHALGATRRRVKIHIELETGMARHGVSLDTLPKFLRVVKKYPNIQVEGVMSHLADADNAASNDFDELQTKLFDEAVSLILKTGFKPKYFHLAQSAGSSKVTSRYANAIRVGIALYGINPLSKTDPAYDQFKDLQPALALYSTISKVNEVGAGTTVSYGRIFTAQTDTRIGVLPLGYYEGFKRSLSNVGLVEYKNSYLHVAGRVNMNHTMIDLGSSGAQLGDTVTVISSRPESKVSVRNICKEHELFSYDLLVGLNQNIRRRVVD